MQVHQNHQHQLNLRVQHRQLNHLYLLDQLNLVLVEQEQGVVQHHE
jgi:hypothetical protein